MYSYFTFLFSIVVFTMTLTPVYALESGHKNNENLLLLLEQCEKHFKAGRLTTGYKGNALTCYKKVLKIEPNNAEALISLEMIEARYITTVNNALEEENLKKALRYIARLRQVNPNSSKLRELITAVKQEQKISSKIKLSHLLQVCQVHLKADRLTTGYSGNAFACYQNVLKEKPNNTMALAGLKQIEARYVMLIERALEGNQQERVKQYLARLRQVNPHSPYLTLKKEVQTVVQKPSVQNPSNPKNNLLTVDHKNVFRHSLRKGDLGPEMVWVPEGRFQMGSLQEEGLLIIT